MAGELERMNPEMMVVDLTALFVQNLAATVTKDLLKGYFEHFGDVHSVKICHDQTKRPLGYGYVNFHGRDDAEEAIKTLNFSIFHGKSINISYSLHDPKYPRNSNANLFVKNLPKSISDRDFYHMFTVYGDIMSSKIQKDDSGESKGYGFVQFQDENSASRAIEELNGKLLVDHLKLYVGLFISHIDRQKAMQETNFTNVFVKNLSESTTDVNLINIFGMFGSIKSVVVMTDGDGKSKCFGFVDFELPKEAARAVEKLNGEEFNGKKWYVGRAQKRKERELELRIRKERIAKERLIRLNNLYVKNFGDEVDDDKLNEWFSPFGTISSCKVMRDEKGVSRGYGFVAFATSQEASRAIAEMKGQMRGGKPLYVAVAQKKEDRQSQLWAMYANNLPHTIMPIDASHVPMQPTRSPSPVPGFSGQAPPVILPHMPPVRCSTSQLVSVMRPFFPEMLMPMAPRVAQASHPMLYQQMLQGNLFHLPPGFVVPNFNAQRAGEGSSRVQEIRGSLSVEALSSALVNASLTDQHQMLGEKLFPLVQEIESELAPKVTGMLLEMDQAEVIHLLESPQSLREKVAEAIAVIIRNLNGEEGSLLS